MYPLITIGKMQIMTFSLFTLISIFICFGVLAYKYRFDIKQFYLIRKTVLHAVIGIIIGGKTLSALTLFDGSVKNFFYWLIYGGTVFYGGFIGGMLSLFIICKRNNINFLYISDNVLGILPLGQAIGRIGCYFNGCCYGKITNGVLAYDYVVQGIKTSVYPTWFIEMVGCLIIFLIFKKKKFKDGGGDTTFLYLILYSILRFFIEFLRGDEIRGIYLGGLSTSQIISILIVILTLIMKRRKIL